MNEEIKARWLTALRSGEYKQGHGQLKDDDGTLCCLGVLCEIAVGDEVIRPPVCKTNEGSFWRYAGSAGALPPTVLDWAGLDPGRHGGSVRVLVQSDKYGVVQSLIECNDVLKMTFPEIANVIEEQL